MHEPQSLTDFEMPELLKMTQSGERFLHFDSGAKENNGFDHSSRTRLSQWCK